MPQSDANLDNFIKRASSLLSASEKNLQDLTEQINQYLEAASDTDANGHRLPLTNLHYLHKQANYLTSQSQALKKFLNNTGQSVPLAKYPLSRVQILQRQEEERARTAKDLEDSIAQLLANAIFELAAVKQLVTSEGDLNELISGIDSLQEELEVGLAGLRFLIAGLEPMETLGSFGLIAGLRRYLEKFSHQTGIEISYQPQIVLEHLPRTLELAIFRIVQEALQNIDQHAKATHVRVMITEKDNHLQFDVIDDGLGLNHHTVSLNQRRLGLVGMKDLTDILEGELQLKSEKNKGTKITLTIPYPHF